jgi:uncharacterized repeat protein (TIGR03803 family)
MPKQLPSTRINHLLAFAIAFAIGALASSEAHAQTFKVAYNFTNGDDGGNPLAGLVMNKAGNFYGTTSAGGNSGAGTVFKITKAGKMVVLYNFTGGAEGGSPQASLLLKGSTLYGTTSSGGAFGNGVVFKMSGKGVERVLYSFKGGTDGSSPQASLAIDAAGNFYGTTFAGGTSGNGTVFEVTPKGRETILHSFGGGDGANPVAGVTFDTSGNLYGTTSAGGLYGNGNVFQLTAESGWTETTLHDFQLGTDGGVPYSGLVFDGSGNMFGATTDGGQGGSNGGGTVFELTPSGGNWTFNTLYALAGWGISGSFRDLLLDASGNIFATTHCDGQNDAGTVYELANSGGVWTYTELYTFTGGSDGLYSFSNLVADKEGNLYGTTKQGGANGYGVVFKVTP